MNKEDADFYSKINYYKKLWMDARAANENLLAENINLKAELNRRVAPSDLITTLQDQLSVARYEIAQLKSDKQELMDK